MPICGTVSQISPPIRIVLVAVIGLIAAWMLFLRPKTEPTPAPTPAPATAPGVTGLSKAVDKAKDASATSDKANEKVQKATGDDDAAKADAGKSGSAKETAPQFVTGRELPLEPLTAEQTKDLPKVIVKALDKRQVFVVGVFDTKEKRWARMARDDRAVRRELSKTNRYKGEVVATSSTLGKLSSLNAVIGDLGVTQTPSVVVVDRNRKAVVLTGFVERNAINQAIADARRNSTEVRITDPYVRTLNRTCANFDIRLDRFDLPATRAQVKPASRRFGRLISQLPDQVRLAQGAGQVQGRPAPGRPRTWPRARTWRSRCAPATSPRWTPPTRRCSSRPRAWTASSRPPAPPPASRTARPLRTPPRLGGVDRERFAEHLSAPAGRGVPVTGGHDGAAGGAACGDLIRITLRVEGDTVALAGFEASGCGALTAAASAAVTLVEGEPLLDAARVGAHDDLRGARRALAGQVPRRRPGRGRAARRARPRRARAGGAGARRRAARWWR